MKDEQSVKRGRLLNKVGESISLIDLPHTVRIGIDGIDAAGKSTFAEELAGTLANFGVPVIRASIDDFHNPKAIRYGKGRLSPYGYYQDSFDYPGIISYLLEPLGPLGDGVYQPGTYDYRVGQVRASSDRKAPAKAVLLFDGIFLNRLELSSYWDHVIYLDISFEECLVRALDRDSDLIGSTELVKERYLKRYIPGQEPYIAECRPKQRADVVIDNEDPLHPKIVRFDLPVYPGIITTRAG